MGLLTMAPFAVAVVVAATVLQVESLKCYQCTNCNTVSSQQLLTCNITLPVPPPIPPTDPPAPGTNPPPAGTDPPPAGTDPPPAGTDPPPAGTDPPPAGTDPPPVGTDPPQAGTDPPPAGTDPPPAGTDPPPAGTDPPPAGTDPPPAETDPPPAGTDPPPAGTDPPPAGTDPPPAGTDPPPAETDPPPAGTDPPPAGTDPPAAGTDPPAAGTNPPTQTDAPNPGEFKVSRVKRSIKLDDNLREELFDDDCFCQNEYCNCGGRIFFSSYDDIKAINLTLVCVTDSITINGTTIINRGCGVKANTTEQTCNLSNYSQNCKPCETDGCNSLAISLQFSSLLLIPVFLASFVK